MDKAMTMAMQDKRGEGASRRTRLAMRLYAIDGLTDGKTGGEEPGLLIHLYGIATGGDAPDSACANAPNPKGSGGETRAAIGLRQAGGGVSAHTNTPAC